MILIIIINLKNIGHEGNVTGLPKDELLKLISKSKIVLELSKSRTSIVKNYASESTYKFYYLYYKFLARFDYTVQNKFLD